MSEYYYTEYNLFKINFTEAVTPLMCGVVDLHDHIFFFLNMILFVVLYILFSTMNYFGYLSNTITKYKTLLFASASMRYTWIRLNHGTAIEIIWTLLPSLVLVLIAVPSFALLYATDELIDPALTIKVIGHQWYWSYECHDFSALYNNLLPGTENILSFNFDSYMQQDEDLNLGDLRLLETTEALVLPKFTHIRFLITADDVIHSWAVPSLGIKVDAVPGRINQAHTFIMRSGVFYGQCSELCGVNHAFMPIQIVALDPSFYYNYVAEYFNNILINNNN